MPKNKVNNSAIAEENKNKIFTFLKELNGARSNVRQISLTTKLSYPISIKWVEVLLAEGKIKEERVGNARTLWAG